MKTVYIITQRYGRDEPRTIGVFTNHADAINAASGAHRAYNGSGEPIRSRKENGMQSADWADKNSTPFIWLREHALNDEVNP